MRDSNNSRQIENYPSSLLLMGSSTMFTKKGRNKYEEQVELRRGPWTLEEDTILIHYIACHGEGRWNLLARCSGLKRTGKSCRLRWLNYLKPDVKRGNFTPEEHILILELHSKWGNRWSRIAQSLPRRTDNEIKNYWRTRVQKQARQLKIDANSTLFRDVVRCLWMPKLIEKMSIQSTDPIGDKHLAQPSQSSTMIPISCYPQLQYSESNCSTSRLISANNSSSMGMMECPRASQPTTITNDHHQIAANIDYNQLIFNEYDLNDLEFYSTMVGQGVVAASASDYSMIENTSMDKYDMEDSLWSNIWMNCGNTKSYINGESRE